MRGYLALKRAGRLHLVSTAKESLTNHTLRLSHQEFSPVVMGQGLEKSEIITRQYLLTRIGGLNLNRALLLALGKKQTGIVFYLPREWREILSLHGFKIANVRSAILWQLYVLSLLLYGVMQMGKIVLSAITSSKPDSRKLNYSYFADLGRGNLPQINNGSSSHDVISWYIYWPDRRKGTEIVCHNVANALPITVGDIPVISCRGPLPDLAGLRAVATYAVWGLHASFIATFDWLRGRWWHALLLNQAALAAQARILAPNSLAREYLFHNSGWIYRPLWTYEAENKGSAITFYFYSANCESFKKSDSNPSLPYGWKAMTWPRYLVWDEYQADFVRRAAGKNANISVVGHIWFQSSAAEMPQFNKPGVAVFDVTPHRHSRYCTLGLDCEFYIPANSNMFLEQIANITHQLDAVMLWKRKRKIDSIAHPYYRHFADKLAERSDVISVDPEVSAIRVIESSCAVISMPFTSTALIAREMGKPSAYYDPAGQVQRDDRAAHGIPVISKAEDLEAWLYSQVKINEYIESCTEKRVN